VHLIVLRAQAKRGLVDFGEDDDAEASADVPQRAKKHEKHAAKQGINGRQQQKAQVHNLDRFD
jgi:hypothetical protein